MAQQRRLRSTADYAVDQGATILVICNHCGARMLRGTADEARASITAHLLTTHPGDHRCKDHNRDRRR